MNASYLVPSATCRTETEVANSRFITTIACVTSTDEAKHFLASIRAEMPDASHHVYAFRVGYGNSVIEGKSDAGEPPGTAGPPLLSILRGTDIGDTIVVISRYFGGKKLGTGGLVRAYSDAAKTGLKTVIFTTKASTLPVRIETPYNLYESIRQLIMRIEGAINEENFDATVMIKASIPTNRMSEFSQQLLEISAGKVQPIILGDS
jgi:uncharacterized YigZ family protein